MAHLRPDKPQDNGGSGREEVKNFRGVKALFFPPTCKMVGVDRKTKGDSFIYTLFDQQNPRREFKLLYDRQTGRWEIISLPDDIAPLKAEWIESKLKEVNNKPTTSTKIGG